MSGEVNIQERTQKLVDALWNDGEVGAKARAKAKEMFPDIVIPEDNINPAINPLKEQLGEMAEQLRAMREEREAERKEAEARAHQVSFENRIEHARDKYNLTADGYNKMLDRMKETQNYTDADAAAAWVVQQTPPQVERPYTPGIDRRANLFGSGHVEDNDYYRLLHTDPLAYQDLQLREFMADPDKYVSETFSL